MAGDKDKGLEKIRHSLAHILAMAVLDLYADKRGLNAERRGKEGVQLGIGPIIENGFYYDFDFSQTNTDKRGFKHGSTQITAEDLPRIEERM